jgi:Cu(I)-responsive transcriptional regulator
LLTIGDLAKAAGTKVVTIRYYEKIGLLPEPSRTAANYRSYDESHRNRLTFIRRCRQLGFTLDQVRDLLRLASDSRQACDDVDRLTAAHLAEIEQKLSDLRSLADELHAIKSRCQGGGTIADCRIIEALCRTAPMPQA